MEILKHRDTKAGWLGQDRKAKLREQGIEVPALIARVGFENVLDDPNSEKGKAEVRTMLTELIAAEGLMEVKKFNGPVTKFKPTKILSEDPWGINLAGARVKE